MLIFSTLLLQITSTSTYVASALIYTENTVVVLLTLLMVLAVSMQIVRGYFLSVLRKFTLRLTAGIW